MGKLKRHLITLALEEFRWGWKEGSWKKKVFSYGNIMILDCSLGWGGGEGGCEGKKNSNNVEGGTQKNDAKKNLTTQKQTCGGRKRILAPGSTLAAKPKKET